MVLHNTYIPPQNLFLLSNEYTTLHNGSYKSHVSFELKNSVIIPPNVDVYIQLNSFKFVNAFYNVNNNNNIFYYSLSTNINTILTYQIPVGQYTINNLISTLNTGLSNNNIVLSYDNTKFKITFTSASYSFIIRTGKNHCLDIIGLSSETVQSSSVTSDKLINLSGVQVLYLSLPNIKLSSNTSKASNLNNVLECITVDNLIGSTESYYNSNTNNRYRIFENYINFIEVMLNDEKGRLVDFNNTDWFLNISLIFVYKFQYIAPLSLDLNNQDNIDNNIEKINNI